VQRSERFRRENGVKDKHHSRLRAFLSSHSVGICGEIGRVNGQRSDVRSCRCNIHRAQPRDRPLRVSTNRTHRPQTEKSGAGGKGAKTGSRCHNAHFNQERFAAFVAGREGFVALAVRGTIGEAWEPR
jgi:hypothetical protein